MKTWEASFRVEIFAVAETILTSYLRFGGNFLLRLALAFLSLSVAFS